MEQGVRCAFLLGFVLGGSWLAGPVAGSGASLPLPPGDPRIVRSTTAAPWLFLQPGTAQEPRISPAERHPALRVNPSPPPRPVGPMIQEAFLCSGITTDNKPGPAKNAFPTGTRSLTLFLSASGAVPEASLTIEFENAGARFYQRQILISGSRNLGITLQNSRGFTPGDYLCRISLNGIVKKEIPFTVAK